jgi:hypothetical protein
MYKVSEGPGTQLNMRRGWRNGIQMRAEEAQVVRGEVQKCGGKDKEREYGKW